MKPDYDVAVLGGGSAGICAAVASARQGSSTALIERASRLGGMGTRALVHTFCGLYKPDVSNPPVVANSGLPAEIERAMRLRTNQSEPNLMGKVYVLLQDPAEFATLAQELTTNEGNLTVLYEADCTGIVHDRCFQITTNKGKISASALVDTSADAAAAGYLGATRHQAKTLQKPAFIFALQNIAAEAFEESFKMRLALDLVRAVQKGVLPGAMLGAASRASTRPGELYFTIDLNDPSHGPSLARLLVSYLKNHSPAFAKVGSPIFPEIPGIRESNRWLGQYVLTGEDLIKGTQFDDVVAFASWPIELRETTRGPRFKYFDQPRSSEIPLRSLTSSEIPGVFCAGRCLSATHEALASVRVMGTCFATGQAAGVAASLHARGLNPTADLVLGKIGKL